MLWICRHAVCVYDDAVWMTIWTLFYGASLKHCEWRQNWKYQRLLRWVFWDHQWSDLCRGHSGCNRNDPEQDSHRQRGSCRDSIVWSNRSFWCWSGDWNIHFYLYDVLTSTAWSVWETTHSSSCCFNLSKTLILEMDISRDPAVGSRDFECFCNIKWCYHSV